MINYAYWWYEWRRNWDHARHNRLWWEHIAITSYRANRRKPRRKGRA